MQTRFLIAALALSCAACSVEQKRDGDIPSDWRVYVAPGNHVTYVMPVTMNDGTRCVLVIGNSAGRAVSCEWERK